MDRICPTPVDILNAMQNIERHSMNPQNQLEITFGSHLAAGQQFRPRQTRLERGRWWFRRMHEVVEQAVDWQDAPGARPEQTHLKLSRNDLPKAA